MRRISAIPVLDVDCQQRTNNLSPIPLHTLALALLLSHSFLMHTPLITSKERLTRILLSQISKGVFPSLTSTLIDKTTQLSNISALVLTQRMSGFLFSTPRRVLDPTY